MKAAKSGAKVLILTGHRYVRIILFFFAIIFIILSMSKDYSMPRIDSPIRRKRLMTEDNIPFPSKGSTSLKKARINTMGQELPSPTRQNSLRTLKPVASSLSPIKYYETRLNLSCEAWAAYNCIEKIYKRGWKPNGSAQFSGLFRLLVVKTFFDLVVSNPEVESICIRTNTYLLPEKLRKEGKLLHGSRKLKGKQEQDYFFAENTISPLKDLISGLLICNYAELSFYSAIFIGFLLAKLKENSQYLKEHPGYLTIDSYSQGAALLNVFVDHVNHSLGSCFPNSYCTNSCEFYSTPNELARFFSELIGLYKRVLILLECKELSSAIRFQVGYKFYEDRNKKYISERTHLPNHVVLSCRGLHNFGVVSYNKLTTNVLVLYDCKFSMADVDINRIEDWLRAVAKPPLDKPVQKGQKSRILPLLKLLE